MGCVPLTRYAPTVPCANMRAHSDIRNILILEKHDELLSCLFVCRLSPLLLPPLSAGCCSFACILMRHSSVSVPTERPGQSVRSRLSSRLLHEVTLFFLTAQDTRVQHRPVVDAQRHVNSERRFANAKTRMEERECSFPLSPTIYPPGFVLRVNSLRLKTPRPRVCVYVRGFSRAINSFTPVAVCFVLCFLNFVLKKTNGSCSDAQKLLGRFQSLDEFCEITVVRPRNGQHPLKCNFTETYNFIRGRRRERRAKLEGGRRGQSLRRKTLETGIPVLLLYMCLILLIYIRFFCILVFFIVIKNTFHVEQKPYNQYFLRVAFKFGFVS